MLVELWSGVTSFEYDSQSVAWCNNWLFSRVIRRIFLTTKLPNERLIIENLEKNNNAEKHAMVDSNMVRHCYLCQFKQNIFTHCK